MMDGGLATAAAAAVAAAAVDVSRVDAAEAYATGPDATGPDASRADASQASSSSETVATCSGCETGLALSVAASLQESGEFRNDVLHLLKSILRVLEGNSELALVLALIAAVLSAAAAMGQGLSDKLHGTPGVILAVVMAVSEVALICRAIWLCLRKKCGPREATDLESGGGGRGWYRLCR
jgi:hypothetical protein